LKVSRTATSDNGIASFSVSLSLRIQHSPEEEEGEEKEEDDDDISVVDEEEEVLDDSRVPGGATMRRNFACLGTPLVPGETGILSKTRTTAPRWRLPIAELSSEGSPRMLRVLLGEIITTYKPVPVPSSGSEDASEDPPLIEEEEEEEKEEEEEAEGEEVGNLAT
jgi:hypothetical protein